MKRIRTQNDFEGITLVETLLYIGLVIILIFALTTLFGTVNRVKVRAQVIDTVNHQGSELVRYMVEEIRTANNIAEPAGGAVGGVCTVRSSDGAKGEITFSLSGGKLFVTEASGSNTPIQISSNDVIISNLSFTNASQTDTHGSIKFQLTISYLNPNGQTQFNYSEIFYGTASTRY